MTFTSGAEQKKKSYFYNHQIQKRLVQDILEFSACWYSSKIYILRIVFFSFKSDFNLRKGYWFHIMCPWLRGHCANIINYKKNNNKKNYWHGIVQLELEEFLNWIFQYLLVQNLNFKKLILTDGKNRNSQFCEFLNMCTFLENTERTIKCRR